MVVNRNHILLAFLADLIAVLILALSGDQNLGGTLQLIDALTGLLLILGGGVVGAQVPVAPAPGTVTTTRTGP
jgi:hypothetical protein